MALVAREGLSKQGLYLSLTVTFNSLFMRIMTLTDLSDVSVRSLAASALVAAWAIQAALARYYLMF